MRVGNSAVTHKGRAGLELSEVERDMEYKKSILVQLDLHVNITD